MSEIPLIAAIIVNWNRCDLLVEAVKSLYEDDWKNLKIIVVDNGSTDGSVETIKSQFPEVVLIVNNRNTGFSFANNQGFEYAINFGAEYIFLLNNDAIIEIGCLRTLSSYLLRNPKCGAVAPYIFYAEPNEKIWFGGGIAQLWCGRIGHKHIREMFNPDRHKSNICGYLTGCAYLVRAGIIRNLGGFDPSYGLYSEDVDLSIRMRRAGWELWTIPEAKVYHKVSASAGGIGSPLKAFHLGRSSAILMKRYVATPIWLLLIPFGFVGGVYRSIRLMFQSRFSSAIAMWRGIWSGMTGSRIPEKFRLSIND